MRKKGSKWLSLKCQLACWIKSKGLKSTISINVEIICDVHYVLVIKLMKNINEKTT
jgi:hypothetical protein